MPTYIGFTLCAREIFRLFDVNLRSDFNELNSSLYREVDNLERRRLIGITDVRIYPTDKGQYVLGYKLKEFNNVWDNTMLDVDDTIIMLLNRKKKLMSELSRIGVNMTNIEIEYMEGDPEFVENPQPRVFTWN